ncbi:MAG TPA: hypothetical protein VFB73_03215 [Chloroflexota bacterium]|nr:hypothetical protein [Chloroflexota bacterium]
MQHTASPRAPEGASTWPRLVFYAVLGFLAAACGVGRSATNGTPTLIPQPTPDRTVDAVVRGLVTLAPGGPMRTGTPLGTATALTQRTPSMLAAGPAGRGEGSTASAPAGSSVPTRPPSSAPTPVASPSAPPTLRGTAAVPQSAAAERTAQGAAATHATIEPTPQRTPVSAATAAPTATIARPTPTRARAAATAVPAPTFGRMPEANGGARP